MPEAPIKHSHIGASSCERWWNCPGSVVLNQTEKKEASKYSAEGTVAHNIAAKCLEGNWKYSQLEKLLGDTVMEEDFEILVTEEMIESVWFFVETVRESLEEDTILLVEMPLNMAEIDPDLFGTGDAVVIKPFQWIKVFDLKYGAGVPVSAFKNKQGLYYLGCVWLKEDVHEGEIIIVQPRINKDEKCSRYKVSKEEMENFLCELPERIKETRSKDLILHAGAWCRKTFCSAVASCPEASKHVQEVTASKFESIPSPQQLSISDIHKVLTRAEFVVSWVNSVKDYAKELMLNGENIPGFKLVKSYGQRKWQSEEAVIADFHDIHGDKLYEEPKLKSPAKLDKILGKKVVEDYAFKPKIAPKLVPEDAKGEPINCISAQEAFKGV